MNSLLSVGQTELSAPLANPSDQSSRATVIKRSDRIAQEAPAQVTKLPPANQVFEESLKKIQGSGVSNLRVCPSTDPSQHAASVQAMGRLVVPEGEELEFSPEDWEKLRRPFHISEDTGARILEFLNINREEHPGFEVMPWDNIWEANQKGPGSADRPKYAWLYALGLLKIVGSGLVAGGFGSAIWAYSSINEKAKEHEASYTGARAILTCIGAVSLGVCMAVENHIIWHTQPRATAEIDHEKAFIGVLLPLYKGSVKAIRAPQGQGSTCPSDDVESKGSPPVRTQITWDMFKSPTQDEASHSRSSSSGAALLALVHDGAMAQSPSAECPTAVRRQMSCPL